MVFRNVKHFKFAQKQHLYRTLQKAEQRIKQLKVNKYHVHLLLPIEYTELFRLYTNYFKGYQVHFKKQQRQQII